MEELPPSRSDDNDDNMFRPMNAANTRPSAHVERSLIPVYLGLLLALSLACLAILVLVLDASPLFAIANIFPGVLIGLAVILMPAGEHLGWRKKYWNAFRLIMLIIGLLFMVPFEIPSGLFQIIVSLFALPLSIAYVIDRLNRRRKAKVSTRNRD